MANVEKSHLPAAAADMLDGPIGRLSGLVTQPILLARLMALQKYLSEIEVPWKFKKQVEVSVRAWGAVAGALEGGAQGLAPEDKRAFTEYAEAARDKAQSVVDQAVRRRAGDAGGLWGYWRASLDSTRQGFTIVGLGDPFEPDRALGGDDEGKGLWWVKWWPAVLVGGVVVYFTGPRMAAAFVNAVGGQVRGGVEDWRSRGEQRRELPPPSAEA